MRLYFNNKAYEVSFENHGFEKLTPGQQQDREMRMLALVIHRLNQPHTPKTFKITAAALKDTALDSDLISKVQRQFPQAEIPPSLLSSYKTERHLWEGAPSLPKPPSLGRRASISSVEEDDDTDKLNSSHTRTDQRLGRLGDRFSHINRRKK